MQAILTKSLSILGEFRSDSCLAESMDATRERAVPGRPFNHAGAPQVRRLPVLNLERKPTGEIPNLS